MNFERFVVRISGAACSIASIYFIFINEVSAASILMVACFVALFWYIWTEDK